MAGRDWVARLVMQLQDEASPKMGRLQKAALDSGSALDKLAFYGKIGAAAFATIGVATIAGVTKFALWGASVQKGYMQLGSLVGGMDKAQVMMDVAAKATGNLANKQELLPSVMRLVNMGLISNADDTQKVITLTGKMAGIAVKTVPEAVEALTNALATGRTQGLRPFGFDTEKLKDRMDELKQQFPDASSKELMWMAIQEQMSAVISKGSGTVMNFSLSMQALKNRMIDFAADLSMRLVPVLDSIAPALQGLFPVVEQAANELMNRLLPAFQNVANGVSQAIQVATQSGAIQQFASVFGQFLAFIMNVFAQLIPIFAGFASIVMVSLGPAFSHIIEIAGYLASILINALGIALQVVAGIIQGIGPGLNVFFGALAECYRIISAALNPVLQQLGAILGDVARVVGGALGQIMIAFTPILLQLATAFANVITWVGGVITALAPFISTFVNLVAPAIVGVIVALLNLASTILGILIPGFGNLNASGQDLGTKIGPVFVKIGEVIKNLADGATRDIDKITKWLNDHKDTINKYVKPAWETLKDVVERAIKLICGIVAGFGKLLTGDFQGAIGEFKGAFGDAFSGLGTTVSDAFSGKINPAAALGVGLLFLLFKGGLFGGGGGQGGGGIPGLFGNLFGMLTGQTTTGWGGITGATQAGAIPMNNAVTGNASKASALWKIGLGLMTGNTALIIMGVAGLFTNGIAQMAMSAGQGGNQASQKWKGGLIGMPGHTGQIVDQAGNVLYQGTQNMGGQAQQGAQGVSNQFGAGVGGIPGQMGGALGGAGGMMGLLFPLLTGQMGLGAGGLSGGFGSGVGGIPGQMGGALGGAGSTMGLLFPLLTGQMGLGAGGMGNAFGGGIGGMPGQMGGAMGGVGGLMSLLFPGLQGQMGMGAGGMGGAFGSGIGGMPGMMGGSMGGVGGLMSLLFPGLQGQMGMGAGGMSGAFGGGIAPMPGQMQGGFNALGGIMGGPGGFPLLHFLFGAGSGGLNSILGGVMLGGIPLTGIVGMGLLGLGIAGAWGFIHGDFRSSSGQLQQILGGNMDSFPTVAGMRMTTLGGVISTGMAQILTGWGFSWGDAKRIADQTVMGVQETWNGGWQTLGGIFETGKVTVTGITAAARDVIKGDFSGAWQHIKDTATDLFKKGGPLDNTMNGIFGIIDGTIGAALRACGINVDLSWANIKNTISWWLDEIKRTLENVWNGITGWLSGKWQEIKDTAEAKWRDIKYTIGHWIEETEGKIRAAWDGIRKWLTEHWENMKRDSAEFWKGIGNAIIDKINAIIGGVEGFVNFFADAVQWIIDRIGLGIKVGRVTIGRVQKLKKGGITEGGMTLVGENGPELMMAPAGMRVFNNKQTMGMLGEDMAATAGFGKGGFLEDVGRVVGTIGNWLTDRFEDIKSFIAHGVDWIIDQAFGALKLVAPAWPGAFGEIGVKLFDKLKEGLKARVRAWIEEIGRRIAEEEARRAAASGMGMQWFPLIQKYWPREQWVNAFKVMLGESGGNANAVGDHGSSIGLFQVRWDMPGRPSKQQLFDPDFNVRYAADLFRREGWRPWTIAQFLGLVPGIAAQLGRLPDYVRNANPFAVAAGPGGATQNPYWSRYGYPAPAYGPITNTSHPGYSAIDIGAPMGSGIYASARAMVAQAGWMGGYGQAVILRHLSDANSTLYAHMSQIMVSVGQMVEKGQQIGKIGSTGFSTGPHLHYEVRRAAHGADFVAKHPTLLMVGDGITPEHVIVSPAAGAQARHGYGPGQNGSTINNILNYTAVRKEPGRKDAVRAMRELEMLARLRR